MSAPNEKKYTVEMPGRDQIEVIVDAASPTTPKVRFRGCSEMIDLMQTMRRNFGVDPSKWPLPSGDTHAEMLLRELVLKLRGEWFLAYKEAELCHCRKVSAATVDQAILAGAHTPQIVSRQTSASTACGTCRPDVQRMIEHRLHVGLPSAAPVTSPNDVPVTGPPTSPQKKTA